MTIDRREHLVSLNVSFHAVGTPCMRIIHQCQIGVGCSHVVNVFHAWLETLVSSANRNNLELFMKDGKSFM